MEVRLKVKKLLENYDFVYIPNYTSKHEVKQCALLEVKGILEELNGLNIYDYVVSEKLTGKILFWEEVEEEIRMLD